MAQPLLKCGPFSGVDTTTEPYYLPEGKGAQASNVDISYQLGAFSTAFGRSLLGTVALPAGYSITGLAQLVSYVGDNPITVSRLYVISATNAAGASYQCWYDPVAKTTTQLPVASPFTQAVQFGSALWTNGGDKIFHITGSKLASDAWQIQVPYQYSFNVTGTYATTAGSAPVDTYTYAITLRKAESWQQTGAAPSIVLYPDVDSLQESSPVFSTSVTVAAGQQPGFFVPASLGLTNLITGVTIGGVTYYGCLYRTRMSNPTYTFVDYLVNLTQMNDHAGNASIIDTYSDAQIQNNATLIIHHDPPPVLGQTYPGAIQNNSSPNSLAQANQQVSFIYKNPAFIAKHKSRLCAFTLYPTEPLGGSPTSATTSLQPQLWFSDYGTPWSFNDDASQNQVLLVGPEDTPGNAAIDTGAAKYPIWNQGLVEDTPMPIVSIGSILVEFKTQTTWITYGDSPSEFISRRAFDIGCAAPNSVTAAEGGVFWLAPQGVYFFNGAEPEYISEDVRGLIQTFTWAQQQAAVGGYGSRAFYLAFPTVTLVYYTSTKKWYTLPYGATAALSSPFNANSVIFANGSALYNVGTSPSSDLGNPVVGTWQGGVSDSGAPGVLKNYRFLQLVAPNQQGTVLVTLTLDPNFATASTKKWMWDLSKGNGAFVASINAEGYEAQLTITAMTVVTSGTPITIRSAVVHGETKVGLSPTTLADQSGALNGVLAG